jgi:hypothetical protein
MISAAVAALVVGDYVLHRSCEPDGCGVADQRPLQGIFMRNLQRLQSAAL